MKISPHPYNAIDMFMLFLRNLCSLLRLFNSIKDNI